MSVPTYHPIDNQAHDIKVPQSKLLLRRPGNDLVWPAIIGLLVPISISGLGYAWISWEVLLRLALPRAVEVIHLVLVLELET